jgi:hypothetical protein
MSSRVCKLAGNRDSRGYGKAAQNLKRASEVELRKIWKDHETDVDIGHTHPPARPKEPISFGTKAIGFG